MLKFFKRNKNKDTIKSDINQNANQGASEAAIPAEEAKVTNLDSVSAPDMLSVNESSQDLEFKHKQDNTANNQEGVKKGLFSRLYSGLSKTRKQIFGGISSIFTGKVVIDDDLWEELESHLLLADVGIEVTSEILEELRSEISRRDSKSIESLKEVLKTKLSSILVPCQKPLDVVNSKPSNQPYVLLMVGVNGAGKTTTIGKLASQFKKQGMSVMLAAGDTFRAAAVEQLIVWGARNDVPVVAQKTGADSASVVFDAYQSAKAKNIDILIADTAGRLHTQSNLMQELAKIKRVLNKQSNDAPHEVMLVLDASMGQNALQQAKQFQKIVDVSGITLTKLDGTAKGGVIFAIARALGIPIRYIGVGEGMDDLQQFNAEDFVNALIE